MKTKLVYLLLFSCLLQTAVKAQIKFDSTSINNQFQIADKKAIEIKVKVDSIKIKVDTLNTNISKITSSPCNTCKLSFMKWLLVFSPVLLFAIILLIIRKKLTDFDLKGALTENEMPKITVDNPLYNFSNINALISNPAAIGLITNLIPSTIEKSATGDYPKSSSRYIALITSALTWIIVLCLTCFFIYYYLSTNKAPDLSGLSTLMLALGIGVIPYAFNKVATAIK